MTLHTPRQHLARPSAMKRWAVGGLLAALTPVAFAAFSITTIHEGSTPNPARPLYQIDTDAGLVFRVRAWDNGVSTQSAGDITSILYNGVQYADATRGTQLNSGADFLYTGVSAVGVKAELVDANGVVTPASTAHNGVVNGSHYIKLTLTSTSALGGKLTHYYMVRKGEPHIHMATHFTEEPSTLNLVRFIARVPTAALPNGPAAGVPGGLTSDGHWPQDLRGTGAAIEASDVFGFPSTDPRAGQSRSKHYANMRLKDWQYFGGTRTTTGAGPVGMWFWRDNNEGGSGGPFYRSLLNQITSTNNELTYIVNYGEAQTEAFRMGILNSYTLMFTNGAPPTARPDTSWYGVMGLEGYLGPQGRGGVTVAGLNGRVPGVAYTVGFAAPQGQYWADADPVDGHIAIDGMRPGSYTMTVYKGELEVHRESVTVTANTSYALNPITISADPAAVPALWRIGTWDGTPLEFVNGSRLTTMHPSDVRNASWSPPAYVVGQSQPGTGFPAYQWQSVNSPRVIRFVLRRGQTVPLTLRIGTTTDFQSARPVVQVNNWTSAIPPAPPKGTRNLTVGTYRGVNRIYSFNIPASQLVVGTNTISISVASGTPGATFLSPGLSFDAIDLIPTPAP